jgi:hypothetical protein
MITNALTERFLPEDQLRGRKSSTSVNLKTLMAGAHSMEELSAWLEFIIFFECCSVELVGAIAAAN